MLDTWRALPKRLRVVVPGLVIAGVVALYLAATAYYRDFPSDYSFWLIVSPFCGPFAEIWHSSIVSYSPRLMTGWAMLLGGLIALHPLRPNLLTAVVSSLGIAVWILLGVAISTVRY